MAVTQGTSNPQDPPNHTDHCFIKKAFDVVQNGNPSKLKRLLIDTAGPLSVRKGHTPPVGRGLSLFALVKRHVPC